MKKKMAVRPLFQSASPAVRVAISALRSAQATPPGGNAARVCVLIGPFPSLPVVRTDP